MMLVKREQTQEAQKVFLVKMLEKPGGRLSGKSRSRLTLSPGRNSEDPCHSDESY